MLAVYPARDPVGVPLPGDVGGARGRRDAPCFATQHQLLRYYTPRGRRRSILHAGCVMTKQPSRQRVRALRTRGPFELEPPRCITLGRAEATDRRSHSHAARVCSQLTRAARPPTQDVYTGDPTLSQIG